jgi:phage minor structural protein
MAKYYIINQSGENLGPLQGCTSIQWKTSFNESLASEIHVRATSENMENLKKWNYIYRIDGVTGEDSMMFIEYVEYSTDGQTITLKGHPDLLDNVVNTTTATIKNISSFTSVISNCQRWAPYTFKLSSSQPTLPDLTSYETTFDSIREMIQEFCTQQGCGYKVTRTIDDGLNFTIQFYTGNTSINSTFSDAYGNLLEQKYIEDVSSYKNIAYVYGEEKDGEARKNVTVDLRKAGEPLLELYVDAKDLQSTYKDSSGTEKTYTDEEYKALLKARGISKLAETSSDVYQYTFDVNPNNSICKLGVDYKLGDIVSIYSVRYGFRFSARISAITYTEESGKSASTLTIDILNKEDI